MKLSKRAISLTAIVTGALILAASAFADVLIGSGYNSLKGAIKTTAEKLTDDTESFGMEFMWIIKADNSPIMSSSGSYLYDLTNDSYKQITTTKEIDGTVNEYFYYSDRDGTISHDFGSDKYYLNNRKRESDKKVIENPFRDDEAKDIERIVDALTGSLQEVIQTEQTDGKIIYTGNISDTEVPPLINAFSSYMMKYSILPEKNAGDWEIPYLSSDIFIESASGKAIENEDGIIEAVFGNAAVKGSDKNGNEHNYSIELTVNITGINSTVVERPDLTGCDVEEFYYHDDGSCIDGKYIGKYICNVIETENNSFIKTGEKVLEITEADGNSASGTISESYRDGYAPENIKNFSFTATKEEGNYYLTFKYNENGVEKTGMIFDNGPQLQVEYDVELEKGKRGYSSEGNSDIFERVFD